MGLYPSLLFVVLPFLNQQSIVLDFPKVQSCGTVVEPSWSYQVKIYCSVVVELLLLMSYQSLVDLDSLVLTCWSYRHLLFLYWLLLASDCWVLEPLLAPSGVGRLQDLKLSRLLCSVAVVLSLFTASMFSLDRIAIL